MTDRLVKCSLVLTLLRFSQANITSLCGSADMYWEVQEGRQDNTFTCTGFLAQDSVQWDHWVSSTYGSTYLGECPARPSDGSQPLCSKPLSPFFTPNRISDEASVMLVNASGAPSTRLFDKGRLGCIAVRQMLPAGVASCRLDYIYAADNTSCTIQFRNDTWTAFGQCSTQKAYSAQNRYRCEWIQTKQSSLLIANISMTVVPSVGTYVSGSCEFTSYLPPEGHYTYHVTVVPGEVTSSTSFIGSNEIRSPSIKPFYNCPQYVLEGDNIRCTCFVSDLGSPSGVLQWNSTHSAELLLVDVNILYLRSYVCQLLWNNTLVQYVEYIPQMASPPSVPIIFPLNDLSESHAYPFLVGTSGTLRCQSNQTGRPDATYSWPVAGSGHASGNNLTFYSLSKEDNEKTVKCRSSNSYTENRQLVDDATFVLQVYYNPVVKFSSVSDANDCVEVVTKTDYTICLVAEGQRVHISCAADSNPKPASFQWMSQRNTIYSNISELVIMSANSTIHTGDYNCTVVTQQENKDNRLPLTSTATFSIIVGYSPSVLSFDINNFGSKIVSVDEGSDVEMRCRCDGRPTPSIQLGNGREPQLLNQSQPPADISASEQSGEITFSIHQVSCEASAVYICDVSNRLGQDSETRTLLVSCNVYKSGQYGCAGAPRGSNTDGNPTSIIITNGAGILSFKMTAYPIPEVKTIAFLGTNESNEANPVKEKSVSASCSSTTLAPAAVTCNIMFINMTQNEEGYYRIIFSNIFGEMAFSFLVRVSQDNSQEETIEKRDKYIAAVIVLAVVLTLVLLFLFAVIWVWRRGWILSCPAIISERNTHHSHVRGDTSQNDHSATTTSNPYSSRDGQAGPFYDALQMDNVGKQSTYQELQLQQSDSGTTTYEVVSSHPRKTRKEPIYVN